MGVDGVSTGECAGVSVDFESCAHLAIAALLTAAARAVGTVYSPQGNIENTKKGKK